MVYCTHDPYSNIGRGENMDHSETSEVVTAANEGEEYVCRLKTKKKTLDYSQYKFYNKDKGFRFLKFLHRGVANIFLRAYLKCVHRVKVIGKENVAALKKSGAVVVSNHIHPLDIQMISLFVFGMRPVHWLTLQRNMDLSVRFFIRNSGGVPIPEDHDLKKKCFAEMRQVLHDGGLLHICPEGSLVSMCEDIRPFKDGAFRFAFENRVPLVPVTLRFEDADKNGKKFRHPHFVIDVAEPIYPTVPQDVLKEKTQRVMRGRCKKLAVKKM